MRIWPRSRYCPVWGVLAFVVFLGGVESGRLDLLFAGAILLFVATSAYLTYHVESEHRVKKALEVISMLVVFCVVFYGYFVTRSSILGATMLFIIGMVLFAFVVSYLLPRLRTNLLLSGKTGVNP